MSDCKFYDKDGNLLTICHELAAAESRLAVMQRLYIQACEQRDDALELLHDWREQWGDGAQPSGDLIDSTDALLKRNGPEDAGK